MEIECDILDIAAADYTIFAENIPLEFDAINNDYDDDIKEYFSTKIFPGKIIDVIESFSLYNKICLYLIIITIHLIFSQISKYT